MRPLMTMLFCTAMTLFVAGCSDDDPVRPPAPEKLSERDMFFAGGGATVANSLTASVRVGPNGAVDNVLFSLPLTAADHGKTFTINALTNPDFLDAVAIITNGVDDRVMELMELAGGGSASIEGDESTYFEGGVSGTFTPDFKGASIIYVQVTVDSIAIESPGRDPNGNGNWTDWYFRARAVVMGRP